MKCSASLAGPSPCRFPMYLPRGTSAKLLNQDAIWLRCVWSSSEGRQSSQYWRPKRIRRHM